MLVLTRRAGEALFLGNDIKVTMIKVRGGQVRLAIEAPSSVSIHREELLKGGPGKKVSSARDVAQTAC
ncbi:carbon storage regulator CsrA [bacterium]|nr:carbon storage regulator CsrA [bacterium]